MKAEDSTGLIDKRRLLFAAAAVAAITFVVFLPALQNGFVNWDDGQYIYENPNITKLNLESLKWMFTTFHASNYHPLTWLSHAIDYAIWGLNPLGHHLTSIIIHSINTLLVVLLIYRLLTYKRETPSGKTNYVLAAAITGLLFGIHPLRVESVVWVSERKDLLCGFFYISTLLWYLEYTEKHQKKYYLLTLFCFILALLSKPMAVSLPVVLILLDIYPLKRFNIKREFSEKLPFVLLSGASSVVTIIAQEAGGGLLPLEAHPFTTRLLVATRGIVFYLYKMLLPLGLSPVYPYPKNVSFLSLEFGGSLLIVIGITTLCVLLWKRNIKWLLILWAYYLITLLPVLGIIQVGVQSAADRYTYLPSLGPFLLIGLGASHILKGSPLWKESLVLGARALALAIMFTLAFLTVKQTSIWHDPFTLWYTELKRYPDVAMAYTNLGVAYGKTGQYKKAIFYLKKAIELNPRDPDNYNNLAIAYGKLGFHQQAIDILQKVIKLHPEEGIYYYNLGIAYGKLGNYQKAIETLNRAIKLKPDFGKAYYHRGLGYLSQGLHDKAMEDFRKAAELGYKRAIEALKTLSK